MSQFEDFCNKLGGKYKKDFETVCKDDSYNEEKCLNQSLNVHQYIQAASEQMFYYSLEKVCSPLGHDVKINPENGTDVDVSFDGAPFHLRVEIKTPELFENTDTYAKNKKAGIEMYGEQDHRYPEEIIKREDIEGQLESLTSAIGSKATIKRPRDNKIKDYLEGAQEKMVESDASTINILLICLDSDEMCSFFDYIVNPYSGLSGIRPYIPAEAYSKVDFIVLSNCVEAHLDKNFRFNVWDFNNYANFVIPNRNKMSEEGFKEKIPFVLSLFNDNFVKYTKDRKTYITVSGEIVNSDRFGVINYLAKNYIHFVPNKDQRKY